MLIKYCITCFVWILNNEEMKNLIKIMAFIMVSFSVLSCMSQPAKTAQWITHEDFQHEPNQWFKIRKNFKLSKKPK